MKHLSLRYQPAPPQVRHLAVGFVERRDTVAGGAALELPLHYPLAQFLLDADYLVSDVNGTLAAPRAGLWGPSSRTRRARSEGRLHAFVVILTARGARAVSGAGLAALVDRRIDLAGAPDFRAAADFEDRAGLACRWLAEVSARAPSAACDLVEGIAEHQLRGSVAALSRRAGVSPRALHDRFTRQSGWPPKTWLRVSRLQRVLRTVHPSPWGEATAEDARLEFTDEAHLARDFQGLTGLTLASYRRMKRASGDPLLHTVLTPA